MAKAFAVRVFPYTLLTTLGMRAKNPPELIPLTTMKTTSGATLVEIGQMASMLNALTVNERTSDEIGPMKSPRIPKPTRPKADARL